MGIYSGTWKDGDGVGFDPAAFSIQARDPVTTGTVEVYGTLNPDATGTYNYAGTQDGKPYFERNDAAFVLWWDAANARWYIATAIAAPPAAYWWSPDTFEALYGPAGGYTGSAFTFNTPHPDLIIAGAPNPDPTGSYQQTGILNAVPYWKRLDSAYYLFWHAGFSTFLLADVLGKNAPPFWFNFQHVQADFAPIGGYVGTAWPAYDTFPDIIVTGTSNPDTSGTYEHAGTHNTFPYWTRVDDAFSLWLQQPPGRYAISVAPDDVAAGQWFALHQLTDVQAAVAPYTGNPQPDQYIITTIPAYGTFRLRIHGRRGGSGSPPGLYHGSIHQQAAREAFQAVTRHYVEKPAEHSALITGILAPDITGWYGIVNPFNERDCWASVPTGFTIWWDDVTPVWIISTNPGILPGEDVDYWSRLDADPVGVFTAGGTAAGNATLAYE